MDDKTMPLSAAAIDAPAIPPEVIDLVRFLCATWTEIDRWAYANADRNADSNALCEYPVIQGTCSQLDLQRIGEHAYDATSVRKAINWMLEQARKN